MEWLMEKFTQAITVSEAPIQNAIKDNDGIVGSTAVSSDEVHAGTTIRVLGQRSDGRWNCVIEKGNEKIEFIANNGEPQSIPIKSLMLLALGLISIAVIAFPGAFIIPLLSALGFGSAGITAGSFAAGIQGPAIVSGSLFSLAQSYAMGGYAVPIVNGCFQAGAWAGLSKAVREGQEITIYASKLEIRSWFRRIVERFWP